MALLGEFQLKHRPFKNQSALLKSFEEKDFLTHPQKERFEIVCQGLLNLIQEEPEPCFLLGSCLLFLTEINKKNLLESIFKFSNFEMWLNEKSGLRDEDNQRVRAKIMGRYVPREEFQLFFPIGIKKEYSGSHIVAAHTSPDLDTTVASFWGWADAFTAKIGSSLHTWNVPGGKPADQDAIIFYNLFGEQVFDYLAKPQTALTLTALDLCSSRNMRLMPADTAIANVDHNDNSQLITLVDSEGYYMGEWHHSDADGVYQVINLLNSTLRWYENHLHGQLISGFAHKTLSKEKLPKLIESLLETSLISLAPCQELTPTHEQYFEAYLSKVLGLSQGLNSSMKDLFKQAAKLGIENFLTFIEQIEELGSSDIYNKEGQLVDHCSSVLTFLEKIIKELDAAISSLRKYVESLGVAVAIKTHVLGRPPRYVGTRADVSESRQAMGNSSFLPVIYTDESGRQIPVGAISAKDLYHPILGTLTLRDFCNRDEVKIASYLEVISTIDHHKSHLQTTQAPVAIIGDVQSSNVLLALMQFEINDRYLRTGLKAASLEKQLSELMAKKLLSPSETRKLQRLLGQRSLQQQKAAYFIHHDREICEYFSILYAILDDTDLLAKVSKRDVRCVVELLNRLASLTQGEETEIIHLDDIPHDESFAKEAAQKILKNEQMYSIYSKMYEYKEQAVLKNLKAALQDEASSLLSDTKIQNGLARVGQCKLFKNNIAQVHEHREALMNYWLKNSQSAQRNNGDLDLHMLMLSTISGAQEVYEGVKPYSHKDQLWIWAPSTMRAHDHLSSFLSNFQNNMDLIALELEVELINDNGQLSKLFKRRMPQVAVKETSSKAVSESLIVWHYRAGSLNSRKSAITPSLPQLIT